MIVKKLFYNRLKYKLKHYTAFNAPINVIIDYKREMKKFNNKYQGKRCFIIGNGPSLCADDLDLIKNEYSFAANKIYKIFDKTKWRPTFYCIQDTEFAVSMGTEMKVAMDVAESVFFRMKTYKFINDIVKEYNNLIFIPLVEPNYSSSTIEFSQNADRYIYDGWTVTYMSVQLASFMGFKEIYLLGVDHSFPFEIKNDGKIYTVDKSIAAHFYENAQDNYGLNAPKHRANISGLVTLGYQAAEDYSRKYQNFRIFNATRGGKLEVFERVCLEDVINVSKPYE